MSYFPQTITPNMSAPKDIPIPSTEPSPTKAVSARGWAEYFGQGPNGEYQPLGLQHIITGQRVPHREGQCLRLVLQGDMWVPVDYCNLRVTNLPAGMTADTFRGLWTQFSGICSVSIRPDKLQPRKSAGFISFRTPNEAKTALAAQNGAGAQGLRMKVSYHRPILNPAEKRDLAAR